MKFHVNENCIGCGMCEGTCPEIFKVGADSRAHAKDTDVAGPTLSKAQEAMENCPVVAIEAE